MADTFQSIISILDKFACVMTWRPIVIFKTPKAIAYRIIFLTEYWNAWMSIKLFLAIKEAQWLVALVAYNYNKITKGQQDWPFWRKCPTRAFSSPIARIVERIWGLWHHHVVVIAHTTTRHTAHAIGGLTPALIRSRLMLVRKTIYHRQRCG